MVVGAGVSSTTNQRPPPIPGTIRGTGNPAAAFALACTGARRSPAGASSPEDRGNDFLDMETYPEITFVTGGVLVSEQVVLEFEVSATRHT